MPTKFKREKGSRFGSEVTFISRAAGASPFTANATTTQDIPSPVRRSLVERITVQQRVLVVDADGTVLFTAKKWDQSAAAAVSLTAATSLEVDVQTAKKAQVVALLSTLTDAQLTLDEGDYVYWEVVSNSVAIDTQPTDFCVTVELLVLE